MIWNKYLHCSQHKCLPWFQNMDLDHQLMMLYECSPYPMETLFVCNILAILGTSIQLGKKLEKKS